MAENAKIVPISRDLEGGNEPRQSQSSESNAAFEPPKKPDFLTGRESAHWDDLVESLGRQHRVINNLDGDMLAIYVREYSKWIQAEIDLDLSGMYQVFATGARQLSPEFTASEKCAKQALMFARQLGLTPPSRLAMKVGVSENQGDLFGDM